MRRLAAFCLVAVCGLASFITLFGLLIPLVTDLEGRLISGETIAETAFCLHYSHSVRDGITIIIVTREAQCKVFDREK